MLGLIKSIGIRAISSIPTLGSKTRIIVPQDPNLQDKLKEISNQILRAQPTEQFKIYQQLQAVQNSNFNRNLRTIYQHEGCNTQMINSIIRFYTFLLTNCKDELIICKLVSQPLVIQLTKIVLHAQGNKNDQDKDQDQEMQDRQNEQSLIECLDSLEQPQQQDTTQQKQTKNPKQIKSLHYLHNIDWQEVNAYKVALIRCYINCINPQTIKYMIVDNQLPIFVNCVNGYKHYLSDGVEGTCISNCVLMIMTKVNHNDEVCQIIFDSQHKLRVNCNQVQKVDFDRQSLSKTISNQRSIKLHEFVKEVIKRIGLQMAKVLQTLSSETQKNENNNIYTQLRQFKKLQINMQFIESNILFCVDLINSINNYNYTAKIKQNIGESIETELIGRIIQYVQKQPNPVTEPNKTRFNLTVLKLIRFVLNLSISCQKSEEKIINFLNKNSLHILSNIISFNKAVFQDPQQNPTPKLTNQNDIATNQPSLAKESSSPGMFQKECLTYLCNYSLILLKQTISPISKLASRKRLQMSHEVVQLKQKILSCLFVLLEQITKSEQLKQGICFKSIRNLLLCIFYLTIKEDKCTLNMKTLNKPQQPNLGLALQFKYNILTLHRIFAQLFKKIFVIQKNWHFIVNNYEALMRQIPNNILTPEQNDKFCNFHNGNNYHQEDEIRNRIIIYEAVRNYRYMIIHETGLQNKLIKLENIYHKHFLSPGWSYQPGEKIKFNSPQQYKIICMGLLHSNNNNKLPIQIIQDCQCMLISHKLSECNYQVIANIRYKKIDSFISEGRNLVRMKLIGIQELILEFGSIKSQGVFKGYLEENVNRTREKQLKFISYYLNMYLEDSQKLIQQMYNQDLVGLQGESPKKSQESQNTQTLSKNLRLQNKQTNSIESLAQQDKIDKQDKFQQNPLQQQKSEYKQEHLINQTKQI